MADRIQAILVEPRDPSLPIDVQGVNLRRQAINHMGRVGVIEENSVRYHGASDTASVKLGSVELSLWQNNLMSALFYADGDVLKSIVTEHAVYQSDSRTGYFVSYVRDAYN